VTIAVLDEGTEANAQCPRNSSQHHEGRVYPSALDFAEDSGVDASNTRHGLNRDFGLTGGKRLSIPTNARQLI
jgi:hypothetical protein